jgi:hypothetical protein
VKMTTNVNGATRVIRYIGHRFKKENYSTEFEGY